MSSGFQTNYFVNRTGHKEHESTKRELRWNYISHM